MMSESVFIFIRHGESQKNLKDITGGDGESLSPNGVMQVEEIAKKVIPDLPTRAVDVFSSNPIQVQESANIFSRKLHAKVVVLPTLSGAGLGIISGLSSSQISNRFPKISKDFSLWRLQKLEAIDLRIDGMESPIDFWERIVNNFIYKNLSGRINLVFCTRSVMVLIQNFLKGNSPEKGGKYIHYPINYCESIAFSVDENRHKKLLQEYTFK